MEENSGDIFPSLKTKQNYVLSSMWQFHMHMYTLVIFTPITLSHSAKPLLPRTPVPRIFISLSILGTHWPKFNYGCLCEQGKKWLHHQRKRVQLHPKLLLLFSSCHGSAEGLVLSEHLETARSAPCMSLLLSLRHPPPLLDYDWPSLICFVSTLLEASASACWYWSVASVWTFAFHSLEILHFRYRVLFFKKIHFYRTTHLVIFKSYTRHLTTRNCRALGHLSHWWEFCLSCQPDQ